MCRPFPTFNVTGKEYRFSKTTSRTQNGSLGRLWISRSTFLTSRWQDFWRLINADRSPSLLTGSIPTARPDYRCRLPIPAADTESSTLGSPCCSLLREPDSTTRSIADADFRLPPGPAFPRRCGCLPRMVPTPRVVLEIRARRPGRSFANSDPYRSKATVASLATM